MKWFKHYSDSYSNLKQQAVIAEFGMEGYGFFWVCDELVAQQGEESRIRAGKGWKKALAYITRISGERIENMLIFFAEVNLIDQEALSKGDLYMPKLSEYGDEYSSRKKPTSTNSRQTPDSVVLEEIRIEEKRVDKNRREESTEIVAFAPTPKESALKFFEMVSEGTIEFEDLIQSICASSRASPELIRRELNKFTNYWTEPTPSGKKQLWETKKTFEVKRRLVTWLGNIKQFSGSKEHINKYIPAIV